MTEPSDGFVGTGLGKAQRIPDLSEFDGVRGGKDFGTRHASTGWGSRCGRGLFSYGFLGHGKNGFGGKGRWLGEGIGTSGGKGSEYGGEKLHGVRCRGRNTKI